MSPCIELIFSIWSKLEEVIAVKLGVQPCFRGYSWDQVRDIMTLQKFASFYASIHNHFDLERHPIFRVTFKQNRSAAFAERRELAA